MFFDRRLWALTEGVRGRIALAVVVGVIASLVGIARLALLGWLVAKVFAGERFDSLLPSFALVAVVMLARGALEYWRTMVAHETAARVQATLRERLYDQVVALGPAHFGVERTGEVLLAMVEGVEQLEVWFGQYLPQLFVAAITPLVVFVLMAFLDLPVALVLLGFAVLTLIAPAAFHSWDAANSQRRQRAYAAYAAELLDSIQGLATLKAFGRSRDRGRMLARKAHDVFRSTMWVLATNSLTRGITDTGLAVGAAAALGYGAFRVSEGEMSLATLLVVLMMGIEVFRPQRDLRSMLHQGMVGLAAAHGIFGVLAAAPRVPTAGLGRLRDDEPLAPTVDFDAVEFTYPEGRSPAHRGMTFSVAAGERVGIVGESGSGKSTIVKLLLRFHDPQAGEVRIGGRPLTGLHPDDVHARIAVVHQDTYLFHGTVADNLRFGRPHATPAELEAAARAANAHEFIERLPSGYDTVIGERGIRLSGGQRQRIAIARALLRDAPILVLDEALSAVDAENEAIIQGALDRLMEGRTTLILAHRLSSVINADRILVLENGAVAESGTHAELMARDGTYHRLMAGQARDRLPADVDLDVPQRARGAAPAAGRDDDVALPPSDAILRAEGMGWGEVLRELFHHVLPWKGRLAMTFFFGVTRVAALIGVGVLSALLVASLRHGGDWSGYLWWLAAVAPLAGVLHWLESWVAHDMAFRLLSDMRVRLYDKLDELAPAYLVHRRTGDLVAMATHDVELIEYFFAHTVAPAFVAVLVPLVVLVTLGVHGWPLAVALAPFLVLVGVSPLLMRAEVDRLGSRAREALAELNAHVVDTIQGLGEVVAFRYQGARREELRERMRRHESVRLPYFRNLTLQDVIVEVATGLGGLVVVVVGAHLTATGALDAAVLPLLTLLALSAFLPVSEIAHTGRQLADTLGATRRLHAVHNEPVPVRSGPRPAPDHAAGAPALSLDAVRFSYFANDRIALDDVGFEVPAGETVALVGPSGAGKTTIAHLLLRFWDPQQGTVRLFGADLRELDLDSLRERIALVTQDTYLFNESLEANIRMARPDATAAELDEAVERASLAPFVASLPDGVATRVGERGVRLSGGQRQRVAIARAFLKDAPVLILDEATSHLDAVNEAAVRDALEELMAERTTLVIAHRLSTVRSADRIVVVDHGRVAESGSHEELMSGRGLYRNLVAHQLASAAAD